MKVKTIRCTECGGPLDIKPKEEQVTCVYCGSRLFVMRGNLVDYHKSEHKGVGYSVRNVEAVKIERKIQVLDEKWMEYHERFESEGYYIIPDEDEITGQLVNRGAWGIIVVLSGLLIRIQGFPAGILLIMVGIVIAISTYGRYESELLRSEEYQEIKVKYEKKRKELVGKLKELEG